jgi:hypothetical protein
VHSGAQSATPAEVTAIASTYLRLVDEQLPGRIAGLYLVGSLALGDYRPGQSDVDLVAVTGSPLDFSELGQLQQLHRQLRHIAPRPALDGIYVTWRQLAAAPQSLSVPYCRDGRFAPQGGFAANPVTWSILHRAPMPIRGPARPPVLHDDDLLRTWCRENLQDYWAAWVRAARTRFKPQLFSLSRQATTWGVLGVTRLHATIRTARILSKSEATTYALQTFPSSWSPIVQEALAARLGTQSIYRNAFARRRDALAFIEYVISDALDRR